MLRRIPFDGLPVERLGLVVPSPVCSLMLQARRHSQQAVQRSPISQAMCRLRDSLRWRARSHPRLPPGFSAILRLPTTASGGHPFLCKRGAMLATSKRPPRTNASSRANVSQCDRGTAELFIFKRRAIWIGLQATFCSPLPSPWLHRTHGLCLSRLTNAAWGRNLRCHLQLPLQRGKRPGGSCRRSQWISPTIRSVPATPRWSSAAWENPARPRLAICMAAS